MRGVVLAIALTASVTAGLPLSPYFDTVLFWLGKTAGPAWTASRAVFHGTTLIITLATLAIASIPAFLTRWVMPRLTGRPISGVWQSVILCVTAIAIAWPALRLAAGLDE